jgi:hypothetical protein
MDLFTPIVSEAEQHPNFRTISKQNNQFNFDVVNEWADDFQDRDGKFVKEFQATFDSSFWELSGVKHSFRSCCLTQQCYRTKLPVTYPFSLY